MTRSLAAACLLAAAACGAPKPTATVLQGRTMGTRYTIKLARVLPADERRALQSAVDARLAQVNALMSTYDPDSELSRFNRAPAGEAFAASAETLIVVGAALRFAAESAGAFDPTVGPLVDLWGFGPEGRITELPAPTKIAAAKQLVGWRAVRLQRSSLKKLTPGLRLDLSAIAKGYGVDQVAALLDERGYGDYMVEIGGEVFTRGRNARGEFWQFGIETPQAEVSPTRSISRVVALSGRGLATSGNYRNNFRHGGKIYSHFIDPRTGWPVENALASASVLAPSCMEADAAATTLMVLGQDKAREWLAAHPGYEALLLWPEGDGFKAWTTAGWPKP